MNVAVYDNPISLTRQLWVNGELVVEVTRRELQEFARDDLPWKPGGLCGNPGAVDGAVTQ